MAEVFSELGVMARDGREFIPRVCGGPLDNVWEGWIEFVAVDDGHVVRTSRETTQPNRTDLAYWATGLTPTYLDGALTRALSPRRLPQERVAAVPAYEGPAPSVIPPRPAVAPPLTDSVLDPFSIYQKGERVLIQQLQALASWHLINIIRTYALSDADAATLKATSHPALVSLIVAAVRTRLEAPSPR